MIGTAKGWTAVRVLAIALATHALLPYYPFPQLSDYAFAATLARGPALAGLALGAAAHAEPVTALHDALAVAAACAATGRPGLRALGRTALAGCATALPVIYSAAVTASGEAIPAGQLIEEGYLFAAPARFRLARAEVLLGWGYLALGLLAGLGLFQAAATLFRAALTAGFAPLYMLDATRSSPLYFALSATLFAAAAERQSARRLTADGWRSLKPLAAAGAIAVGLMVANALATGWLFLLAGLLVIATPDRAVPRVALAATLVLIFVMAIPRFHLRAPAGAQRIAMFEWASRETPADALFIIPPGMTDFRLFARRSIRAESGLFAADPRREWFARERMLQAAQPDPEALALQGWPAMERWDRTYAAAADCRGIARLLDATGTTYFVLPVRETDIGRSAPDCGAGLPAVFENSGFTVDHARQ